MPSTTDFTTLAAGYLTSRLASGATSGARVTVIEANGSTITWPTGAHRIQVRRKTANGLAFETIGVASASQSGSTVTLGTLTRQMSMTDGSTFSSGGNGYTFPANSEVYVSWDVFDAERTMKDDKVNTITGAGAIRGSSTTVPIIRLNNVTTAQRTAMSAANGDLVYDTDLSAAFQYKGGAWVEVGDTGTTAMSTTAAGTGELATVAEQGTATANGGSGAPLVPAVANLVKTSSGAGDENKIAILDSAGKFANGFLATSGTANSTTFLRGDRTWAAPSALYTNKTMEIIESDSATLSNPTSATNYDTHTYTIAANDLVANVVYRFRVSGIFTTGTSSTFGITVKVGGVSFGEMLTGTISALSNLPFTLTGEIIGTTTAGASAAVRMNATLVCVNSSAVVLAIPMYDVQNVATNGTAAIAFAAKFGTSNGSNATTLKTSVYEKLSTTPFA